MRVLPTVILFLQIVSCTIPLPKEVAIAYQATPKKVAFNIDIKPILSDKCYQCHGPDDISYNNTVNPVHVHDFQATLLHLLGVDHERLTFKYQGRRFRLTDVHGHVVKDILAA